MTCKGTLSSKGQITLPQEIRRRMGLKQGDQVEFVIEGGRTILRPAQPEENPFTKWKGAAPYFKNRAEIQAWIRDMRDETSDSK